MKRIQIDYTDPDNRVVTIVDDDAEDQTIEIDNSDHTIVIEGNGVEIKKIAEDDSKITPKELAAGLIVLALLGMAAFVGWEFAGAIWDGGKAIIDWVASLPWR